MMEESATKKFRGSAQLQSLDEQGYPLERRLRLAVAALLWEMAYIDGSVSPDEFVEIIEQLDLEFSPREHETAALVELVDFCKRENELLNSFIDEVNASLTYTERRSLFEMIWRVAEADGYIHSNERAFGIFLQEKLKLS